MKAHCYALQSHQATYVASSHPDLVNNHLSPLTSPAQADEDLMIAEAEEPAKLIVFNDDFNTFDHVIKTLMEICQHTAEQAEQCSIIIHYKGKCCVKTGAWDKIARMRNAICDRGILAEIVD